MNYWYTKQQEYVWKKSCCVKDVTQNTYCISLHIWKKTNLWGYKSEVVAGSRGPERGMGHMSVWESLRTRSLVDSPQLVRESLLCLLSLHNFGNSCHQLVWWELANILWQFDHAVACLWQGIQVQSLWICTKHYLHCGNKQRLTKSEKQRLFIQSLLYSKGVSQEHGSGNTVCTEEGREVKVLWGKVKASFKPWFKAGAAALGKL